ncbi:hypothetical protein [Faecalibaculum rodentium]|uniref:Uncharacterized protein n=1 Tax=Faecalibaculum rodentium TaxID=1702221 RepID=A0A140DVJ0_9FIRM|nr:hypothetical protein [Faecalibaculum rodentium]AMK54667.1 hypothetical protein AALO17_15330 [Faecalibaculum rodentium]
MKSKVLASFQPYYMAGEIALLELRDGFAIAYDHDSEDGTCRKLSFFESLIRATEIYRQYLRRNG